MNSLSFSKAQKADTQIFQTALTLSIALLGFFSIVGTPINLDC